MNLYRDIRNILVEGMEEGEAQAVALLLLERVGGMDRIHALMGADSERREEIVEMARRVACGEPVQYVMGEAEFCGLPFHVETGVLIPRVETEELVEMVCRAKADRGQTPVRIIGSSIEGLEDEKADRGQTPVRILDIGTGSGCIAVTLAKMIEGAEVEAWDVSDDALRIAEGNAERNEVRVAFRKVDVLEYEAKEEDGMFDVIVSNPPYICNKEAEDMERNVLEHEPHLALFVPDDDPLLFYRKISEIAMILLKYGGKLCFEINRAYGKEMVEMLECMGYAEVEVKKDQFGNERMVCAIKRRNVR